MKKNLQMSFSSVGDELAKDYSLVPLLRQVDELNRVSAIIHDYFPDLRGSCHCGAVDYPNDLLVIYVKNSATFQIVNRRINEIEGILIENGYRYGNFKVKVLPEFQKEIINSRKKSLSAEQVEMLKKFAQAIGREDLLKNSDYESAVDENLRNDWEINL